MAVTASTPANLVVGAGDVYVDTDVLGASKGDNTYRIEQEWAVPELNGVPGELIGTRYKTKENAVLQTGVPEVSDTIMELTWAGSRSETVGLETTIDTDGTRRIPTEAYHDWELRVPGLNGKQFSFFADNALQVDNIEFAAQDKDAVAPRTSVRSTWDAADIDEETGLWTASPHRIVVTVPA